jgi:hypothetical protein
MNGARNLVLHGEGSTMNGARRLASRGWLRRGAVRGGAVARPVLAWSLLAAPALLALALGMIAPPALAQTAPAPVPPAVAPGFSSPGLPISPDPRTTPAPCADCRGGEAGGPGSANTIIVTPENKTIVPRTLMREQSDFRVNEALRNVPGVNRR